VLQKQLWLEMDSDIILNKTDLNTCQCRGMVYRLFMSARHTTFMFYHLPSNVSYLIYL